MPIPALAVGAALVPSIFKGISAISQKSRANSINPIDPGYQINNAVIENARSLSNRSRNYLMPAYGATMNNIGATYSDAFNRGMQGATSSGDVLDLATRIAYGQGRAQNQVAAQNAVGAENAYLQSLEANAAAGREYQGKNEWDRQQYLNQLREKAALTQSANENAYGAITDIAGAASNLLMQSNDGENNSVVANPLGSVMSNNISADDYKKLLGNYSLGLNRPVASNYRRF